MTCAAVHGTATTNHRIDLMTNHTPEHWAALQRDTDRWAAQRSDEELSRFARALQLNWRETRSQEAWDALQCIYAVQHERSSSR